MDNNAWIILQDIIQHIENNPINRIIERDELFAEAADYVVDSERASIGNLQRMFRIGFSRASQLIDQLEIAGIIGPGSSTGARPVLMDKSTLISWKAKNL